MPPLTVAPAGADERVERLAWRALADAAQRSRSPAGAAEPAFFAVDERTGLVPLARTALARAWVRWEPTAGWTAQAGAPPAARPLLELYLPLCAASAARPITIAHLGQSLDGHIATATGDSYYVTGPENVRHLHRLRALCDAVVVGAGTVARDDPQLTVRLVNGHNPVRVILDPTGRLDASHRVFMEPTAPTLRVVAAGVRPDSAAGFGCAETLEVPSDDGLLRLDVLLAELHARGLAAVFVEGGGTTVSHFFAANLLDRLHVAIAPLVTGDGQPGLRLAARDKIAECLRPRHRVFRMGADVLFDCDLRAPADEEDPPRGLERVL
jgi:diaminohydroxyphosphoribosylaminopyrimidine deaminase / 5-amino-6-(5-phosphoribosylamino)uracil reductase